MSDKAPKNDKNWPKDEFAWHEVIAQWWGLGVPVVAMLGVLCLSTVSWLKSVRSAHVILYCAQDQTYAEPLVRQFEKETGIRVKAVYDSEAVKTVGLANRLLAERKHPQCDVFWGNEEMRTRQLAAQSVFRETNGWASFGYRTRRLVINTNLVAAGILPAVDPGFQPGGEDAPIANGSLDLVISNDADANPGGRMPPSTAGKMPAATTLLELTNSAWRGKVALAFPQFGTTATHFHALQQHWGEEGWLAWCRALVANEAKVVDGNSVVVKLVGRGEAWIGLTDSDDIFAGQREGLPVAALPLTGEALFIPNTVGAIRNAPHEIAAQKLFDYLQRPEVAELLVAANALESADSAQAQGLQPDWPALLNDLERTTALLNEVFLK